MPATPNVKHGKAYSDEYVAALDQLREIKSDPRYAYGSLNATAIGMLDNIAGSRASDAAKIQRVAAVLDALTFAASQ